MVRPRADASGPGAKERMERAFWLQLSEADYSKMTVDSLCAGAGVNHNTLYYHFNNLDCLALSTVGEKSAAAGMARELVPLYCGDVAACGGRSRVTPQSDFGRAVSVAQNGSRALVSAFLEFSISEWARAGGINPESLTEEDLCRCRAVFGGIVSAISKLPRSKVLPFGMDFGRGPLGSAFSEALESVKTAHAETP